MGNLAVDPCCGYSVRLVGTIIHDMSATSVQPVKQLPRFGPDRCETLSIDEARAMCRRLALGRYENFSVLSGLVPRDRRDDFAAVYAFCRWADDLGDEVGDRGRSLELLAWWRRELQQCFADEPHHPVFIALHPTIRRHDLPIEPFDNLIRAFEQDQTVTRYETWQQVLDYCVLSANPVGRLVLMVCGEDRTDDLFTRSDAICTALQLTNHWQDVKRDILQRDRIYIPRELINAAGIERFEDRLIRSAKQGYAVDQQFLGQTRSVIRECVERTWRLFEQGHSLLPKLSPQTRPIVTLLASGGHHVLRQIELWNYETALHRPKLGKISRVMLVARAWWQARFAGSGGREAA
jgi:squalene synthase HpnC